jgi:hypothetical protein
MSETQFVILETISAPTFSRRARLEDFLDDDNNNTQQKNNRNNNSSYNDTIAKNQQEFGHKKRIKP